jgi:nucleoside-diphosphate-sugar epimerase
VAKIAIAAVPATPRPATLHPRRVALTGSTGFIGRTLVGALAGAGVPAKVLARRPDILGGPGSFEIIPGDLKDGEALRRLVAGATDVVHVAGAIRARRQSEFYEINAEGTARLAEIVAREQPGCRLLLISSLAAREPGLSPYAASKRQAEEAVARWQNEMEYCILRPPAVYGPGDRASLPFFRQVHRGFALIPGTAACRFSLLYVEDLASLILALLDQPGWNGAVIEPDDGRPQGYTWSDFVSIAGAVLGRRLLMIRLPFRTLWPAAVASEAFAAAARRPIMFTRAKLRELYHPDWVCRRSSTPLPWRAETDFGKGFQQTWAWYRDHRWL